MSVWNVCCIDELGSVNRGKSKHRPRNDVILFGGLYPFIQTADVKRANLYITEYNETYSDVGLAQSKLWKKGTLCITIAANIAESAILGIDACFPDSVVGFIPHKEVSDLKFVKYLLDVFKVYMQQISKGTTQDNLSLEKLRRVKFNVPDYITQQKIAHILSRYDEAIENNNKRIKLLEQMAQNLYKEWFVRFRFPGYENCEFENGIPVGWKVEKLGNVANISTGKCNREDAEDDGIYPLFDRSQEIKLSNDWIKDCEAIIVPGEGTSFIPRYFVGKFNLHQRCYCVEPKTDKTGKFLFYTLMLNRKYFLSVATGATVPSLRYNNFAKMKFVMPELGVCQKFDDYITKYFLQIDNLKIANKNLAKQRDLLLPRLMSGKLEVR